MSNKKLQQFKKKKKKKKKKKTLLGLYHEPINMKYLKLVKHFLMSASYSNLEQNLFHFYN